MNERRYLTNSCGQVTGAGMTTGEVTIAPAVGPWTVELISQGGSERRIQLNPGERITLGSRSDANLQVDDPCVSGLHCQLDATGAELTLVDLGSKNGVFVGSARIESAKLANDPTMFVIGKTCVVVRSIGIVGRASAPIEIDGLEGRSQPMLRLKREVHRYARLRAPVLILGETGVGKDVVARALHRLSGRTGAYVPINVATVPETLAESELFGHQKGAFTGAMQARTGAFEQANRGTLFLDEVGELAPSVQAKMLRILEDGVLRPIGASSERRVDVRIVSATWASLSERSAAGKFRYDLLQRLSVMLIEVPPLRERRSDIPLLVDHWLRRYLAEVGPKWLTTQAIERLCEHDWPGNVRELGGTIYRACVSTDSACIDADAIGRALLIDSNCRRRSNQDPHEYLARAAGNVSEAARLAGLPRTTFRTWLRRARQSERDDPDREDANHRS